MAIQRADQSADPATAERQSRRELAAAFRLAAHFGWDDGIATHMSARLPDGSFLLNPFGLLFEEITASNLMRMDLDGTVLEIPDGCFLNPAAFAVHSAVLAGRPDVNCVIHFHSQDGVAVSSLEEGLLPLSQNALMVWNDVAYHDFEGVVSPDEERERLQRDIGDKHLMILRNHGTLAVGRSIAGAFARISALEWACSTQVKTLAMGRPLHLPQPHAVERLNAMATPAWADMIAEQRLWPALLRKAERLFPGFDA
jgi:ribulose-5-phosphate 4-epimerase/fuculose-1-phosphate aldolase